MLVRRGLKHFTILQVLFNEFTFFLLWFNLWVVEKIKSTVWKHRYFMDSRECWRASFVKWIIWCLHCSIWYKKCHKDGKGLLFFFWVSMLQPVFEISGGSWVKKPDKALDLDQVVLSSISIAIIVNLTSIVLIRFRTTRPCPATYPRSQGKTWDPLAPDLSLAPFGFPGNTIFVPYYLQGIRYYAVQVS